MAGAVEGTVGGSVDPIWIPSRRSTASWAVYDLANTIFALGVGSLYFAEWLTDNRSSLPGWLNRGDTADLGLAVAVDAAMIVVIVLEHGGPEV